MPTFHSSAACSLHIDPEREEQRNMKWWCEWIKQRQRDIQREREKEMGSRGYEKHSKGDKLTRNPTVNRATHRHNSGGSCTCLHSNNKSQGKTCDGHQTLWLKSNGVNREEKWRITKGWNVWKDEMKWGEKRRVEIKWEETNWVTTRWQDWR